MASVTTRARAVKQPRGGYIKPSNFKTLHFDDEKILNEEENIHGSIIGMVVDYLTRVSLGSTLEDAFSVSLQGASAAEEIFGMDNAKNIASTLLDGITGIDEKSVINACKLVTFDVWKRKPSEAKMAKGYKETEPDMQTIHNIQVLVQRCVTAFEKYGPIVKSKITFEPEDTDDMCCDSDLYMFSGSRAYGGYTRIVDSGDGDYLTEDTLWEVKVLKSKLTSKHTLQLLMYWIMGQHSGQKVFKSIKRLGIFNPRLNNAYLLDICDIPKDVIEAVEDDVICYMG